MSNATALEMIVVGAMTSGGTSASEVTNESCAASELVKRVASDVMARTEKE